MTKKEMTRGQTAYELRQQGLSWDAIADGLSTYPHNAMILAKQYAKINGEEWPIDLEEK